MPNRKIMLAINLGLVLVLIYVITKIVSAPAETAQSNQQKKTAQQDDATVNSLTPSDATQKDYDDIVKRSLFTKPEPTSGDKSANPDIPTSEIVDAEQELKLKLQGTIAGPENLARAIITNLATKVTGLYRNQDVIAGARIAKIEKHCVILVHNGQRKLLKLEASLSNPQKKLKKSTGLAQKNVSNNTITQKGPRFTNKIIEDIIKTANIKPYSVDNQTQGLRVSDLEKVDMAGLIGLKDGDVIHRVNGQVLTSKQKAFQVFKKARNQTFLDIELIRNNQIKTLSLP